MAIIGRSVLLALTMLLAGCAGLDRSGSTAGEYPEEVYGHGGWNTERDPYWGWRNGYYGPYGWSGFGPYGYWGYPGWWGPPVYYPVYYVYPERDVPTADPARRVRLRPLQERMLRIAPVTPPGSTPPAQVRSLQPSDRADHPGSVRDRLPQSRPESLPAVKPLSMPAPPVFRPPPMRTPESQATPNPRLRRLWRRPGAGEE
ncbi:MAG TPA: hypothetical protein VNK45_04565 [Candidatus Acidoferrales bacterium]|nr:hypothetical protein [Candidatus Acidoferrales bacterium]